MSAFELLPVPPVVGGVGRSNALADDVRALPGSPDNILLVVDPILRSLGITADIERSLAAALDVTRFEAFCSDPGTAHIDAATRLARECGANAVVGIGGGSALDVAKAVAAIAPGAPGVEYYQFARHPLPARPLPSILLPSTAGTGSEATWTAVFTNSEGRKAWVWGQTLAASKAILDPALTTGLPATLTAATGIDALVHAMEACTNRRRFDANDMYCHQAIRLITTHLPRVVRTPDDLVARAAMLLGSFLAGIGINNCGTAIAHNIAHALGSLGKIHHGRAAGLGMRTTLAWNVASGLPAYERVAQCMGCGDAGDLPATFDRLLRDCGVRIAVADELPGVDAEHLAAEMALPENSPMRAANARPVSTNDLLAFARATLQER